VGGVAALCAALTLAELSAALPKAGGEYVILYEAFGPLAGFLSGWVTFLIGFAAPIAASASGSATYLLAPLQLTGWPAQAAQRGVATLTVVAFALIHSSRRTRTARVQVGITLIKLIVLVLFVLAGLACGWHHSANLADLPPMTAAVGSKMLFSMVYITYAYFGWNAASYLAGEVRDPGRQLPRAIVLGTAAVVVLYLGLNTVYALALPASEIQQIAHADRNAVKPIAQLAAVRLFGAIWATPLSIAVGLMLLSSLSAYILTGPRVAYAMAVAGQFPAVAGRLSTRFQTPAIATGLLCALALVLLWSGSFDNIVTYASVGMAFFSILTISSIYVLRWRRPDLKRPFRTPGYPFVPAVYITVSALLTAAALFNNFWVAALSLLSVIAGVPAYYLWTRTQRGAPPEVK